MPPARREEVREQRSGWTGATSWIGIILTAVTMTVTGVLAFANVKGNQDVIRADILLLREDIKSRRAFVDQKLADHDAKFEQTNRSFSEMKAKLDVAVALLERIDAKVGKP